MLRSCAPNATGALEQGRDSSCSAGPGPRAAALRGGCHSGAGSAQGVRPRAPLRAQGPSGSSLHSNSRTTPNSHEMDGTMATSEHQGTRSQKTWPWKRNALPRPAHLGHAAQMTDAFPCTHTFPQTKPRQKVPQSSDPQEAVLYAAPGRACRTPVPILETQTKKRPNRATCFIELMDEALQSGHSHLRDGVLTTQPAQQRHPQPGSHMA